MTKHQDHAGYADPCVSCPVGSIIGMAIAINGFDAVLWSANTPAFPYIKGVVPVFLSWVCSPICAAILVTIVYGIIIRPFVLRAKVPYTRAVRVRVSPLPRHPSASFKPKSLHSPIPVTDRSESQGMVSRLLHAHDTSLLGLLKLLYNCNLVRLSFDLGGAWCAK